VRRLRRRTGRTAVVDDFKGMRDFMPINHRKFRQLQHQVLPMDDNQAFRICQLTDTQKINNLFQPLNKVRVVGTDTHRAAGQVGDIDVSSILYSNHSTPSGIYTYFLL
jgi:hypothetical protein